MPAESAIAHAMASRSIGLICTFAVDGIFGPCRYAARRFTSASGVRSKHDPNSSVRPIERPPHLKRECRPPFLLNPGSPSQSDRLDPARVSKLETMSPSAGVRADASVIAPLNSAAISPDRNTPSELSWLRSQVQSPTATPVPPLTHADHWRRFPGASPRASTIDKAPAWSHVIGVRGPLCEIQRRRKTVRHVPLR